MVRIQLCIPSHIKSVYCLCNVSTGILWSTKRFQSYTGWLYLGFFILSQIIISKTYLKGMTFLRLQIHLNNYTEVWGSMIYRNGRIYQVGLHGNLLWVWSYCYFLYELHNTEKVCFISMQYKLDRPRQKFERILPKPKWSGNTEWNSAICTSKIYAQIEGIACIVGCER